MSSRPVTSSLSRLAKQELVRVLYGPKLSGKGREAHRMLDHSIYSYDELRSSYLENIQMLHPDKKRSSPTISEKERKESKSRFIELQEAWSRYEVLAKSMKQVTKGDKVDSNFTMFGVGCSFADSEAEKSLRREYTDQCCKGWLSAGVLGVGEEEHEKAAAGKLNSPPVSLLDENMFVSEDDDRTVCSTDGGQSVSGPVHNAAKSRSRKNLVSHLMPPHKRK